MNRSAVIPFRHPAAESTRTGILPVCSRLDRGTQDAEVGFEPRTFQSVNSRSNHWAILCHLLCVNPMEGRRAFILIFEVSAVWEKFRGVGTRGNKSPFHIDVEHLQMVIPKQSTGMQMSKLKHTTCSTLLGLESTGMLHVIIIIIDSMTSVFNTDASLPYNHDLFESLIAKKRMKIFTQAIWTETENKNAIDIGWQPYLVVSPTRHSEDHAVPILEGE
ncbi:hypothetical protein T265_01388 [Opisthorchis viverrini]|uniref:Uncharacterized protein n=1 Tax=Opisthorchis viverrini TaxID=6198 RepID=A0A075A9S5_OPIVI|nr:hypothetical protein T265_01388 [Opisthorchis viverrini]KER32510.1 hypothetical protein T265_01388 [Opisthorchis viverrini]